MLNEVDMYKNLDDYELINRILSGDNDAFGEIVSRYKNLVYSVILRMINDYEEANDISQEVFIKVYKNLGKYQPEYKFSTWIMRITTNHVIDFLRKKKQETVNIDEGVTNEEGIEEIVNVDEVAEEKVSTDDVTEMIEEVDDAKPAGDIETFLEDPDVQERTKKAILSMSQEDKIEMLKYIASTLTPQEKFKFLGELLQEFAPESNIPNPPKKRGRPKGSKNRGVTK